MTVAWFIAPYKRDLTDTEPSRYCAMQDFSTLIDADDGYWSESECLGNVAVVKVRASAATLTAIAGGANFQRIPNHFNLSDTLGDLSATQRNAIRNRLTAMGYSTAEISGALPASGNWASVTLRQVLRFAATRRRKPRFDGTNIVLDGIVQTCRDIDDVSSHCFSDADWTRLKGLRDALIAEWNANQQVIRIVVHPLTAALPKYERDAVLVLCGRAGYRFDRIKPDTFPTTGVLDNFNRANEGPPPSASWTTGITGGSNGLKVVSNALAPNDTASADGYWNTTSGPDQEIFFTLPTMFAAGDTFRYWWRVLNPGSGTTDGYRARYTVFGGVDQVIMQRMDNGTGTTLGATHNMAADLANGDKLGGESISSTHATYSYQSAAWGQLFTRSDATYNSAGYVGLSMTIAGTVAIDDFGGGTVSTGYTMTAAQGSYTLTGQSLALNHGFKLTAAQGSYSLTGQAATPKAARLLTAAQGSYSLSGQAVALNHGFILALAQGAYTLSGQDVGLLRGLILALAQGSYVLTGQDATLRRGVSLVMAQGSYTLTGQVTSLLATRLLIAGQGAYTLNGQLADLLATRLLALAQGSYSLAGQNTGLFAGRLLTAFQGSYTLTGQSAGLLASRLLVMAQGGYTLNGQDVVLIFVSALILTQAANVYSGAATIVIKSGAATTNIKSGAATTNIKSGAATITLKDRM